MDYKKISINKFENSKFSVVEDPIIVEFPLTIYINDQEYATLLCTPSKMKELVLGYLFSEYLIGSIEDVLDMVMDEEKGLVYVQLASRPEILQNRYVTSGCASSTAYYKTMDAIKMQGLSPGVIAMQEVFDSIRLLNQHSELFKITGGVHTAALSYGDVIMYAEDVGRHNAVDKLIGHLISAGEKPLDSIMYTSGRISSEIILKCARYGIGVVVSRSAPMDRAVQIAEKLGMVLIGFVRGNRANIYAGKDLIQA